MIGSCDTCDRQNIPVISGEYCGCDVTACFICQGDEFDPYGEMEGCDKCGGEGGWEEGRPQHDDPYFAVVIKCDACNGSGWVEA